MKKIRLLLFLLVLCPVSYLYSQNFEGWILYKSEILNPNPGKISDEEWKEAMKEQLGERGYMLQKYHYKKGNYMSEIDAGKQSGYQTYNPEDGLLYGWQTASDSAMTSDSRKYMDELVEISHTDETVTVMGIDCRSIIIKSKFGSMTIWYNSDHFKMDASLFEGHKYGHWEAMLQAIGCLPLKSEMQMMGMRMVQTAIEYKETQVDDEVFEIPEFRVITANPFN